MRFSTKLFATLAWLAAAAGACAAQQKPAVEYQSLMNLPFYEADGGFLVEHLEMARCISTGG